MIYLVQIKFKFKSIIDSICKQSKFVTLTQVLKFAILNSFCYNTLTKNRIFICCQKIQRGGFMMTNNTQGTGLTDAQRKYVLKLGAARARDIVLIDDLTLYREMIKKDLIVDKGRRVALSRLGKEIYQVIKT